jgi:hypothetical protein
MIETKPWWTSRTIWVGLATSILAILSGMGLLPLGLEQTIVEELITAVLGIATVYYRSKAVKEIEPVM